MTSASWSYALHFVLDVYVVDLLDFWFPVVSTSPAASISIIQWTENSPQDVIFRLPFSSLCFVSVQVSLPYRTVGLITILYILSLVLLLIILLFVAGDRAWNICIQQLCVRFFYVQFIFLTHNCLKVLFFYVQFISLTIVSRYLDLSTFFTFNDWTCSCPCVSLPNLLSLIISVFRSVHLSHTCSAVLGNIVNISSIFSSVLAITSTSSSYAKMFIRVFEKFSYLTAFSITRLNSMSENIHSYLWPLCMLKPFVSFLPTLVHLLLVLHPLIQDNSFEGMLSSAITCHNDRLYTESYACLKSTKS